MLKIGFKRVIKTRLGTKFMTSFRINEVNSKLCSLFNKEKESSKFIQELLPKESFMQSFHE